MYTFLIFKNLYESAKNKCQFTRPIHYVGLYKLHKTANSKDDRGLSPQSRPTKKKNLLGLRGQSCSNFSFISNANY